MEDREDRRDLSRGILTTQIIAAALLTGLLAFAGIALMLVQQQGRGLNPPAGPPIESWVALGFFVAALVLWAVLPRWVARAQVARVAAGTWTPNPRLAASANATDAVKLLAVFQSRTVMASALLEAPGFFAGIAYLLEGQPFALGVVGAAVLLMWASFPTRGRIERWLEAQQAQVDAMRQTGDLPGAT
jgi:hypothetical protein